MFEYSHLGKEIGQLLRKLREKVRLSQTEVAKRIGISPKTGHGFISRLESGQVKSPPLYVILFYLRACGVSWPEFFKELDRIDFKLRHEKMISQLPPEATKRKIQRDAMRYEINVEFPSKEKEEIDFARLKKIIKEKVVRLVSKEENTLTSILSHRGRGGLPNLSLRVPEGDVAISKQVMDNKGLLRRLAPRNDVVGKENQGRVEKAVMTAYQKFALEYFDFMASLNKAGMKMVVDKYQRAGLHLNLIYKIKKIINSVLMGEIKRIEAKKPLPTAKQERMAVGFTRYRMRMERIEAEVHKLLCELGVQASMGKFALYKDFARECYGILKRYYGKEPLGEKFQPIINRWVKEGLKVDVLEKVRDVTIKVFTSK
jgi:transcriptional regulator with XRE-family HTH domain